MKTFVLIWAFFLLSLGFVPCSDVVGSAEPHSHSGKHYPHEKDGCTPFCVCTCCGAVAFQEITHYPKGEILVFINTPPVIYKNLYSQIYINAIWQPPTLA